MLSHKELMKVSKPVRYIGEEINSVLKDGDDYFNVCLAFPDVYEVGMSHLGMKMLYERLNCSELIFAERFFMPWTDAIDELGKDIFVSLETFRPLKQFDVLGFSLQYELSFSNVLASLIHSDIPVRSTDRKDDDPIVIAGGPCVVNPKPLSSFIDAFFIGEMEEMLITVMEELAQISNKSRSEKLNFLNTFDFIYVPSIKKTKKTKRYIHMSFSQEKTITNLLVPLMPIVQDRVAIEISRGCSRGCRFCQAGMIYRPVREKDVDMILNNAVEQIAMSGYSEVSLLSLSASDYTQLEILLLKLAELVKSKKVSLSLPSLRADKIKDYIFKEISKIRKSGFTIAPEAGSQRMRDIVNKNLSEEDIVKAVKVAAENGWNGAKLYFMIGLPFETDEDVVEIGELAKRLKSVTMEVSRRFNITVSVSNFVPKPFTPFQWYPQNSAAEFERKQKLIRDSLHRSRIKYKFHNVHQSVLEGSFSRGDEQMGEVLLQAVKNGNIFDGWGEMFNAFSWNESFEPFGFNVEDVACREFDVLDTLPWDVIDAGIKKDFLIKDYQDSESGESIDDCRVDQCTDCGICDFDTIKNINASLKVIDEQCETLVEESKIYVKYEMIFEKLGKASLLSSIELSRTLHHVFSIVKIDIEFSYGFNPQPRLSYVFPLSVGVEGQNEIVYFSSVKLIDIENIILKLNNLLPNGIRIKEIKNNFDIKKVSDAVIGYRLDRNSFAFLKNKFDNDEAYYIKKNKKGIEKRVKIMDYVKNVKEIVDNHITITISTQGGFNILEFFRYWNYNTSKVDLSREWVKIIQG